MSRTNSAIPQEGSNAARRRSSEYSQQDEKSEQCVVKTNFTDEEKSRGKNKVYGLLLKNPLAIASVIPTIIAGSVSVITFYFLGNIITYLSDYSMGRAENPIDKVSWQCILMLIITIVVTICKFFASTLWIRVGARVSSQIKNEIFTNIMQYDVAFYDTHSIGSLLTILGEDTAVIQECFGATKGLQLQQLGQFIVGWILLMVYSWKMGLIMLCLVPVVIIIMRIFHPFIDYNAKRRFRYISNSITIAEETISAIRTVRGYNREEKDTGRFVDQAINAAKFETKIVYYIGTMFFIVMIIVWGCVTALLYYSSTFVGKRENGRIFEIGTMFSCFGYAMMGSMGLVVLESSIQAENRAVVASSRIVALTSYEASVNFSGGITYDNFQGHIEFKNVSFSYPTRDVLALKNVSFEVKPGETVALVGHSGSGKSTCVQLIERYYDIQEGVITIDGHDIKEIDPRWLHRRIALVSQEPTLFQASVRENVLYGIENHDNVSDDVVWDALEKANAKKFVAKFDKQLGQLVGDRGSTVSGGQRQRIAIARAVIKDPTILICDEATAALDSESEKKVQKALDKILETRTGVIVAHRLTTIRNATRIYVFDAGEILEIGTHDSLVKKGGVYYNLVKRQLQKEEAEAEAGKNKDEKNEEDSSLDED